MAEHDQQDRTESPSQKRLDDARRKGQVARSRDLASAATTLAGGFGLLMLGGNMGGQMLAMMRSPLQFTREQAMNPDHMATLLRDAGWAALLAATPLLGVLLLAAVLAPLLIGGWTFSTSAFAPKWERLDPVSGMGRVFSARGFIEVCKSLARFAVVAVVAVLVLRNQFAEFTALGAEAVQSAVGHGLQLTGEALLLLGGALAIIALVDVPLTLWQHQRALRMTLQEVRDEAKETEGSPEVRGRIRRLQQEMSKRRMMAEVPNAHVIVTNPTHYAVALRYEADKMRAPVVVAKGTDLIALQIRKVGAAHSVPVIEAPPLARALHAGCELGAEVPIRLYAAVAQLLTHVYQLKTAIGAGQPLPTSPEFKID